MAYTNTFDISGQTGKIGVARYGGEITFQQLFTGAPQYYAGSVVQIQEILTIYTDVVRPEVVDVDLAWFVPKKYLGTYQILDGNYGYRHDVGDDGFLVDTIQKIARYSWYTITANPNVPIALDEGFIVDDCNFYTVAEVYLFPGTNTPVPGFRLRHPGDGKPIMRGYTSKTKADLANTTFNNLINGVGLYLNQGVEGIRVDYEVAIINDIYTAYQPFPVSTCELAAPSCLEQYNAYLGTVDVRIYPSEAECLADHPGGTCVSSAPWLCPTDPTQVFEQWTWVNGT